MISRILEFPRQEVKLYRTENRLRPRPENFVCDSSQKPSIEKIVKKYLHLYILWDIVFFNTINRQADLLIKSLVLPPNPKK